MVGHFFTFIISLFLDQIQCWYTSKIFSLAFSNVESQELLCVPFSLVLFVCVLRTLKTLGRISSLLSSVVFTYLSAWSSWLTRLFLFFVAAFI